MSFKKQPNGGKGGNANITRYHRQFIFIYERILARSPIYCGCIRSLTTKHLICTGARFHLGNIKLAFSSFFPFRSTFGECVCMSPLQTTMALLFTTLKTLRARFRYRIHSTHKSSRILERFPHLPLFSFCFIKKYAEMDS